MLRIALYDRRENWEPDLQLSYMTNFIETISKRRAVVAVIRRGFSSRAFVDTLHHALANQARKALDAATAKGWPSLI
jgi:hypothetical protein